jgi:excisionase family DNA binding protein
MLTAKQVGPLLGLSPRKVYELAATGTLPSFRFGDAVRFAPPDVETYRESCRSTKTSPPAAGDSTSTAASTAFASVDRQLLPAGWTRAEADAFDRKESAALYAIATGLARPRHHIGQAVALYLRRSESPS